jgi:imidazole glycerol-phosphate synthase subunit HisH
MLTSGSEEGEGLGLGFIEGKAKHFPSNDIDLKVPHMGWNTITVTKKNPLLNISQPQDQRFYFAHSFFVECYDETDIVSKSEHGISFVSAFQRENVYGVQFHPEKSHKYGMALIKQFSEV